MFIKPIPKSTQDRKIASFLILDTFLDALTIPTINRMFDRMMKIPIVYLIYSLESSSRRKTFVEFVMINPCFLERHVSIIVVFMVFFHKFDIEVSAFSNVD